MARTKIQTLWNEYVPKHLLPRLHGYELLMAPYAIAHLKIRLKLFETGYRFESDERARVYLTNALEPAGDKQLTLDFLPALAHEAEAVNEIKRKAAVHGGDRESTVPGRSRPRRRLDRGAHARSGDPEWPKHVELLRGRRRAA